VRGIPVRRHRRAGRRRHRPQALAAKGVRVFYTQVFRDNFFHADAHAGNIWVDPARRANPRFIALDFGIMGQLSAQDQYYLAENFMAIFQRDYRRIAELHVQAGWMPRAHPHRRTRSRGARGVRALLHPAAGEISLAEVLLKLFRTAQRYELTMQPQLILLQKTLLNIEGVGRRLDPKLDIWAVARPVLETILRERYSPRQLAREFRKRLPELITRAPDMPRLLHDWLAQQVNGQHSLQMRSDDIAQLARIAREAQRQVVYAILGSGLLIVAAVLYALEAGGPRFFGVSAAVWIAGLGALGAFLAAWPRRATRTLSD
jgi:ubiquinone biosynthesis protein